MFSLFIIGKFVLGKHCYPDDRFHVGFCLGEDMLHTLWHSAITAARYFIPESKNLDIVAHAINIEVDPNEGTWMEDRSRDAQESLRYQTTNDEFLTQTINNW